eukprot:6203791-Pleurochrysis_carterae.AAC.2
MATAPAVAAVAVAVAAAAAAVAEEHVLQQPVNARASESRAKSRGNKYAFAMNSKCNKHAVDIAQVQAEPSRCTMVRHSCALASSRWTSYVLTIAFLPVAVAVLI